MTLLELSSLKIQYYRLKFYRLLSKKIYKINSPVVCTENSKLTIGNEYQFREGHYLTRVKLMNISFQDYFMAVDLQFLDEENRLVTCDHKITENITFPGIWQLWDKGRFRKEIE